MIIVITHDVIVMGLDGSSLRIAFVARWTIGRGRIFDQKPSSKQARQGMMVNQFRKDKLPLAIRMNCKNKITIPAICLAIRGQNMNRGAISSARKLYHTPAFKMARGRK